MPDQDQNNPTPPPSGDPKKAEKYISQFISLIEANKLNVIHTDLSKFDPSALEDHYRIELKDYNVEISHSKNPDTGQDSYICLFTNLHEVRQGNSERIILAYMHLDTNQFIRFKKAAHEKLQRQRKAEEEKKFYEVMKPIDHTLDSLINPTLSDYTTDQNNDDTTTTEPTPESTFSEAVHLSPLPEHHLSSSSHAEEHQFPEQLSHSNPTIS